MLFRSVDIILEEANTLFDDMFKNMESNSRLHEFMHNLLFTGRDTKFNIDNPAVNLGNMYGYIKKGKNNKAQVANKIFETRLYEYFLSKHCTSTRQTSNVLQYDIVDGGGHFDMELCMRKFAEYYARMYSLRDAEFIEREGRLLFLYYLQPLINGQGYYHVESELMDQRRMDIVVDFGSEQFIIELKLWRGEAAHNKAYEQLAGYLRVKGFTVGYLLTFDFRNDANKQPYAKWAEFEGMRIFDVVV